MEGLIGTSLFAGKDPREMKTCDELVEWAPEKISEIGFPILAPNGTIRLVVVSNKDKKETFEKVKLAMLPVDWQAIAIAKILAWSRLEADTLPMVTSSRQTLEALRGVAEKLVAERTVGAQCPGWPLTAFEYLGQFIAGKSTSKHEIALAKFSEWKTLPHDPLLEDTKSVAASANEPSGKKRKLSVVAGSGTNYPNHPLMKFITQKANEMSREVDKYVTENEHLNTIIGEKDKGVSDLMMENERMKALIDSKEKEIEAMKAWCHRFVEFTQLNPMPMPQAATAATAPDAAPEAKK